MNRQELNRYIKGKESKTHVIMKCTGEFNTVRLPDEVKTFKVNNQVIMAGHSTIIMKWLNEQIDFIDYYKIEYNKKHAVEEQANATYRQSEVFQQNDYPNIHTSTIIKENVNLKRDTVIANESVIGPNVQIGESCVIGEGCMLSGASEDKSKAITVGNRVIIEDHVIILNGVKIGNDVTIKMGSIVSSDIPDHQVVSGIPAKSITDENQ